MIHTVMLIFLWMSDLTDICSSCVRLSVVCYYASLVISLKCYNKSYCSTYMTNMVGGLHVFI